jgi:hypothetical protein
MSKATIQAFSAMGIICRRSDPRQVLLNMSGANVPERVFRFTLSPFGGERSGPLAHKDTGPLATFRRSVEEGMSISYRQRNHDFPTKGGTGVPYDLAVSFIELRNSILQKAVPWRDYHVSVGHEVLSLVPYPKQSSFDRLVSYFVIELDDDEWAAVLNLQASFETFSKNGYSYPTTLQEILVRGYQFGYGHETAMMDFWLERGFGTARGLTSIATRKAVRLAEPQPAYANYLSDYDILV